MAFWREEPTDKEGLKRAVEKHLVRKMVESRIAKYEGPFLPLKVWAQQGYNEDDIKARAAHRVCPVVGDTYQVKVVTTGHEKKEQMIQDEMLRLLNRRPSLANLSSTGDGDAEVGDDAQQQEGDGDHANPSANPSSDSSTSSESSSSDGKKGKKRKSKKAKKNKEPPGPKVIHFI